MSYRVQYTDQALDSLKKMSSRRRADFSREIGKVALNPYSHGSPVTGRDKRRAVLAGVVTDFWVSQGVLTVTVVSLVHTD
ncbi:type II toxin-antitoxin system RelE family toxin [Streptomyces yaizuensis]|uniref:Type II toxin-antitoxin system RelE/ParE family toxin n=1 Tax=Streptomyces yaizuensis TaxID=2989713 RepID=A0ABQ5NYA0_9ACTN|nr:hypothetical protein [Streptomyces sp. YSPA8]GLF95229.1 hypothetical protein SYYSPA8_13050 [Streptomyces sp. YSPA8]